jgi:excisionase family DNA binding protein
MDGDRTDGDAAGVRDRWLSVTEVGLYLGVSRDTVYRWIRERNFPGHCVGRLWKFKQAEIDRWVQTADHQRSPERAAR